MRNDFFYYVFPDSSMRTRTNGKKILFVVPRVVLADQQLEVIKTQLKGLPEELTRVSTQITKSQSLLLVTESSCDDVTCFKGFTACIPYYL